MQYLFYARTPETQQLRRETYWKREFATNASSKLMFVLSIIYLLFLCISNLHLSYLLQYVYPFGQHHVICIALWLLIVWFIYRKVTEAARAARNFTAYWDQKIGSQPRYSDVFFFEDHLRCQSAVSKDVYIVDYIDLHAVKQTEHYFIIITLGKSVYIVDKRGFEGGNEQAAYAFLRNKLAQNAA